MASPWPGWLALEGLAVVTVQGCYFQGATLVTFLKCQTDHVKLLTHLQAHLAASPYQAHLPECPPRSPFIV